MPLARILVIEDDEDVARLEQTVLERAGYEVRVTGSGAEGLELAESYKPDVVLLDVGLPDISGLDVCTSLSNTNNAFVLMVSGHSREQDILLGLGLGADDYITKPFAPRELIARVKAVLRRFERPTTPSTIAFEDVSIDAGAMQLRVRGELTTTTATEFRLLDYLARHPGRVFSRDHLLDAVWGDARFVTPRSVDVYVRRIREKIETDPENPRYLKTVRGAGYRFEVPKQA